VSRIAGALSALKAGRRKALSVFVTAGVPHARSTVPLVLALERAGADLIEIGLPFSDPLADGPVIQQSSALAIANGVTLRDIFAMIREIRKRSDIPIVLMGYLNPILRFGLDRFCRSAADRGVDGIILPEVPLEEHGAYAPMLARHALDGILLVTPTSSPSRIRAIDEASHGFLYCVSMTGVTGARRAATDSRYLRRVSRIAVRNPVLVGFGIASPGDARRAAAHADGVIIGSAFVRRLLPDGDPDSAVSWIARVRSALDAA
jgi:tryptophan synthase alpha chain